MTTATPMTLGRIYKKTVFHEYTDDSFTKLKPREPQWEHLGILGPMIRAEVGDTIKVVFRNNAKHPHSLHPHGVFYEKASEGAQYDDGTGQKFAVEPGATHTYTWPVPERAGPSHGEGSSIVWMYHSHIEEETRRQCRPHRTLLVTARGKARPDGSPIDVDREIRRRVPRVRREQQLALRGKHQDLRRQRQQGAAGGEFRRSHLHRQSQGNH